MSNDKPTLGFRCPECGGDTHVIDSRPTGEYGIRRRRQCDQMHRFTTFESLGDKSLVIIKRSGAREIYNQDKLLKSIHTALNKRPYNQDALERELADLETTLDKFRATGITSYQLACMVMRMLGRIDPVALSRYSVPYTSQPAQPAPAQEAMAEAS